MSGAKRRGSAGMDRPPSPHRENWAAWVSPQAANPHSALRRVRKAPGPSVPTVRSHQRGRRHDRGGPGAQDAFSEVEAPEPVPAGVLEFPG